MKFGKFVFLASLSAALAVPALADTINYTKGQLTGTGRGTISSAKLTFANITGSDTGVTAGGNNRPKGLVFSGDGNLSEFTTGQSFFYHFINTPASAGPPPVTAVPAVFTYSTASVATPVEFLQVTESGITVKFYITSISGVTVGSSSVKGGFTANGYITLTNTATKQIYETDVAIMQLTNTGTGSGLKTFSYEIDVQNTPEPASLTLLGTGLLGVAGTAFRKRKKA